MRSHVLDGGIADRPLLSRITGSPDLESELTMTYRITLGAKPGWHGVYEREDGTVVVEWYDFGDDAPYESATTLIFDAESQVQLKSVFGLAAVASREAIVRKIAEQFDSYFEIRKFADATAIPYERKVNFWP